MATKKPCRMSRYCAAVIRCRKNGQMNSSKDMAGYDVTFGKHSDENHRNIGGFFSLKSPILFIFKAINVKMDFIAKINWIPIPHPTHGIHHLWTNHWQRFFLDLQCKHWEINAPECEGLDCLDTVVINWCIQWPNTSWTIVIHVFSLFKSYKKLLCSLLVL